MSTAQVSGSLVRPVPIMTEAKQNDRYSRQVLLPEIGERGQELLARAKVMVVGAGGLGSSMLPYLAQAGVGTLGICDGDLVELSNLQRQCLYAEQDVGLKKALAAQKNLQKLNSTIVIQAHAQRVNAENIDELLRPFDVIVDGSDNFQTKFLLHDYCWQNHKNFISASLFKFEGQMQTFSFLGPSSHERACLRCLWPKRPQDGCVGTCAQVGVLGPIAGAMGLFQASEVLKMIVGLPILPHASSWHFNFQNLQSFSSTWDKDPNCPLCSQSSSLNWQTLSEQEKDPIEMSWQQTQAIHTGTQVLWVDVRSLPERLERPFEALSLDEFMALPVNNVQKILVVCAHGIRSRRWANEIRSRGWTQCYSVTGGLAAQNW